MKEVKTLKAPQAIGPYSQAVVSDNLLFCSGQMGIDPTTGELVGPTIREEATQAITNLIHVIESAGYTKAMIVRVEILLTDMKDTSAINGVYEKKFKSDIMPARQTSVVVGLPKGSRFVISCIGVMS